MALCSYCNYDNFFMQLLVNCSSLWCQQLVQARNPWAWRCFCCQQYYQPFANLLFPFYTWERKIFIIIIFNIYFFLQVLLSLCYKQLFWSCEHYVLGLVEEFILLLQTPSKNLYYPFRFLTKPKSYVSIIISQIEVTLGCTNGFGNWFH